MILPSSVAGGGFFGGGILSDFAELATKRAAAVFFGVCSMVRICNGLVCVDFVDFDRFLGRHQLCDIGI